MRGLGRNAVLLPHYFPSLRHASATVLSESSVALDQGSGSSRFDDRAGVGCAPISPDSVPELAFANSLARNSSRSVM
jgi:hypothetical protein